MSRRREPTPPYIIFDPPYSRPIYEGLSYLTGLSILEVAEMGFRMIVEACDPNRDRDGPIYKFWGGVDLEAWKMAQRHAERVMELLGDNPSLSTVLLCQENIVRWLEFWSLRIP